MADSIAERMVRHDNRTSGFDYMRLALAALVVWSHTISVVWGHEATLAVWHSPFRPILAFVLPMFFGLGGFLVAGSLERSRSLISFMGLRTFRIFPALIADTLFAALILGPIFTTMSLSAYFADPLFARYFFNLVGHVQYHLPGVFTENPVPWVNGQLWTLPWDLYGYITLALLALFNLVRHRRLFVGAVLLLCLIAPFRGGMDVLAHIGDGSTVVPVVLVEAFLLGVCLYLYRDKVILKASYCWTAAIAAWIFFLLPAGDYLAVFPALYVTVYLGLLNPPRNRLIASGDYSYGVYLYGFPVQQAVFVLFGPSAWINIVVSTVVVSALAVFSWWCVERQALRLRPALFRLEARLIPILSQMPFGHHLVQPPTGPRLDFTTARAAA